MVYIFIEVFYISFWRFAFTTNSKVAASEQNLLWPSDSERCPGSLATILVWSMNDIPSLCVSLYDRCNMMDILWREGSILFIRWLWVICVCPIPSLIRMTSNFLGMSGRCGHDIIMKTYFLILLIFVKTDV